MPDSIKRSLGPLGGIISIIVLVISSLADLSGLFEKHKNVIEPAIIISAVAAAGFFIYVFIQSRKYTEKVKDYDDLVKKNNDLKESFKEQESTNNSLCESKKSLEKEIVQVRTELKEETNRSKALELLVCDGKKFLDNKATIFFDIVKAKYYLSFEKKYTILTDATKWYEGQFYSNVDLESAEKSQKYYLDNQVSWDDLNISAEMKFKNRGDDAYSQTYQLSVLRVAEGNNYKKFHIQYMTKEGDNLNIRKDAEIVLNYSYEVPVRLWGSYLNRSISYFGEPATVKVQCKDESKIQPDNFKIYETSSINGKKVICDNYGISKDKIRKTSEMTFTLPVRKGPAHYCLWWNAERIFGIPNINTKMTADNSQLTDY